MTFDEALQTIAESDTNNDRPVLTSEPIALPSPSQQQMISTATISNLNIHFATDEKLAYNTKKRIENQVRITLSSILPRFSAKTLVDVVVNDLSVDVVRSLSGHIERSMTVDELGSVFDSHSEQFNKYKTDLKSVFKTMSAIYKKANSVIFLYSRYGSGFARMIS
ncbi:hypothetical protein AB6A40_010447 [Gnathostoma spinigerum]|uniref:Uncharacterized protein n=1 Tax=Gnathostoma spinigerum TaxID=75299 RepID=A0ABD6EUW0_9BILA